MGLGFALISKAAQKHFLLGLTIWEPKWLVPQ
jgi:hypothetical protein